MKYQSNLLGLFLVFLMPFCTSGQDCKKNSKKVVPFIVPLSTQEGECHGIIVSRSYILTNAKCVNGSKNVNIHLTHRKSTSSSSDDSADVLSTNEIISHENFKKVTPAYYQNDLALLKLPLPLNFSLSLRPAAFLLDGEILTGKVAEAVVWKAGYLTIIEGTVQASNSCIKAFEQDFNPSYHFCVMFSNDIFSIIHIDGGMNHPVLVNNNIVGVAIPYPVYDEMGKIYRVYKISPFVKWMTQYTAINKDNEIDDNNYLYDDIENCLFQNIRPENSSLTFKSILQGLVRKQVQTELNDLVQEHVNTTKKIKFETEKRFDAIQKQVNAKGGEIRDEINHKYAMIQSLLSTKEEDIVRRVVERFAELQALLDERGRQLNSVAERLSKLEEKIMMLP